MNLLCGLWRDSEAAEERCRKALGAARAERDFCVAVRDRDWGAVRSFTVVKIFSAVSSRKSCATQMLRESPPVVDAAGRPQVRVYTQDREGTQKTPAARPQKGSALEGFASARWPGWVRGHRGAALEVYRQRALLRCAVAQRQRGECHRSHSVNLPTQ